MILISVILFISFPNKKASLSCDLVDLETASGKSIAQQKFTSDYKILVTFGGFFEYYGAADEVALESKGEDDQRLAIAAAKRKHYQPLRLEKISLTNSTNGEQSLVLWTNCIRISLNFARDLKELVVGSITIVGSTPKGRGYCQIESTGIHFNFRTNYYSCRRLSRNLCVSHKQKTNNTFVIEKVGWLNIEELKLEFSGREESTKNKIFSKTPAHC